jgi:hypothetical protein
MDVQTSHINLKSASALFFYNYLKKNHKIYFVSDKINLVLHQKNLRFAKKKKIS